MNVNNPQTYPVPEDFAERAGWSNRQLKDHYGVGDKTLAKWRKVTGLVAASGRGCIAVAAPVPSDFRDHAPRLTNSALADRYGVSDKTITRWRKETGLTSSIKHFRSAPLPKQSVPPPPPGIANEAAQFLRPTHRPVYHRVIEGKEFKGQYVVGSHIMTEAEIVAYARERGFKTAAEELAAFSKYD